MKTSIILCLFAASACFGLEVIVQDTSVRAGDDVTIPCNYESEDDLAPTEIRWYYIGEDKNDKKIGAVKKADSGNVVTAGTNLPREGIAVTDQGYLKIESTTIQDNLLLADLKCEVEFGQTGQVSKDLKLIVYSTPEEDPQTTVNQDEFDITKDFNTNVGTCTSSASFPASKITFLKNGETVEKLGGGVLNILYDSTNYEKADDNVRETTEKDLMKQLEPSDDKADFVCNVKTIVLGETVYEKNVTMKSFRVAHTTTKVEFENKPTAYLGEEITLKCIANGYPDATIMINDEETSEKTFEVTSDMDGKEFQCSAYNSQPEDAVQSAPYIMKVNSLSQPKIEGASEDGTVEVMYGEDIDITCSSEGFPSPTLAWYKGDNKMSDSEVLNIAKSNFENSATYTCRAYVDGHENLKKSSDVKIDVKGLVLEGEKTVAMEGKKDDELTLECAVMSNPQPTFKWSDGEGNGDQVRTGYTYTSQLTVGPLTTELSKAEYTCTVTTPDGAVVTKTFKLPEIAEASSATAGIIIAILVVLLIVAIILAVLYNKGIICKKQEKGEESAEGDIAVEINNDDADVEAGNGKAAAETEPLVEGNEDDKMANGENSNE